jgi:hypothetical protein
MLLSVIDKIGYKLVFIGSVFVVQALFKMGKAHSFHLCDVFCVLVYQWSATAFNLIPSAASRFLPIF